MLEYLNVVVNTDARLIDDDHIYELHYSVCNSEILSLQCVITKQKGETAESIGYIRKENGRINSDFNEGVSMVEHLKMFELILTEIEETIKPI